VADAQHLNPLVLPVEVRDAERHGAADLYLPDGAAEPCPAVVFVHGGPIAADSAGLACLPGIRVGDRSTRFRRCHS